MKKASKPSAWEGGLRGQAAGPPGEAGLEKATGCCCPPPRGLPAAEQGLLVTRAKMGLMFNQISSYHGVPSIWLVLAAEEAPEGSTQADSRYIIYMNQVSYISFLI